MYACDLSGAFDTYRNNYYVSTCFVVMVFEYYIIYTYTNDVGLKVKKHIKNIILLFLSVLVLVLVNEASGQYFLLTNHQFI